MQISQGGWKWCPKLVSSFHMHQHTCAQKPVHAHALTCIYTIAGTDEWLEY